MGRLVEEGEALLERLREAPDSDLAPEMETLLEVTRGAAARLGITLAEPSADLRHRVHVWSASWWTRMIDCRPEHLRGLGEVDPADARRIEPVVEEIAGHLARLQRLAGD